MMIAFYLVDYIMLIVSFALLILMAYALVMSAFGFKKNKKYKLSDKNYMFAAVIAARNEEKILPYLFESIKNQTYSADFIKTIIIADNCTDRTVEISKEYGAIVVERNDLTKIGKGYALNYAFSNLEEVLKEFDAICIIDADNLIHKDFFKEMNNAFASGVTVAQGYRQIKNPADTWVAGEHSIFYWLQNRFFNRARSCAGLSATINGTGFMMGAERIRREGWPTTTVTEDIETTIRTVLSGEKVGWVPEAIVYDEQPLTFSQSWRQRKRWSTGVLQCMIKYGPSLLLKFIKTRKQQYLDTFLFISAMPLTIVAAVWFVYSGFIDIFIKQDYYMFFIGKLTTLLIYILIAFFIVKIETKIKFSKFLKVVLLYPLFEFTWPLINIVCCLRKDVSWAPVDHTRTISINEMMDVYEKDEELDQKEIEQISEVSTKL